MVGARDPIKVDPVALASPPNTINHNLTSSDQSIATPERFRDHYIGDWQLPSNAQFTTDEHPSVEFLTPVSDRAGKMIKGKVLKFFTDVFSTYQ